MQDFKWFALMFIGIAFALAIGASVATIQETKVIQATATAGLEECPNLLGFKGNTIWVKDCNSFLKQAKEMK